jgi:hypothetical protein
MAAPAYPSFQVTGAVHHYIGWPGMNPADVMYLGTAEATPQVRMIDTSKPVMNDITGPVLPGQKVATGEMAVIAVPFSRWSWSTVQALVARTGPGRRDRFSRGRLKYGLVTFSLWQVFENSLDAATRALYPNLPRGFYFPQVEATEKSFPRLGNQDALWVPTWEAQPYFIPQVNPTVVAAGEREFLLYSWADADFPAATLVPQ